MTPRKTIPDVFPAWAPKDAIEWLHLARRNFPVRTFNRFITLLTDSRMSGVWEWHHEAAGPKGISLCWAVDRCCSLPSFPGNLSAAEREKYFAKVRKHAYALVELLGPSEYGSNSAYVAGFKTTELDNDNLPEIVQRDLAPWGVEETGHVVAYYVDGDGVSRMPWNYPQSSLCDLLYGVICWSEEDDFWDIMRSSRPLENAKGPNRHVTYFTRALHERLERGGLVIPFAHLATAANVALDLPADSQLDEDAARKQVRRYKPQPQPQPKRPPPAF